VFTDVEQQIISSNVLVTMCQSLSIDLLNDCSNEYISSLNGLYYFGTIFRNYECLEDGLNFFCDAISFFCGGPTNDSSLLGEECVQIRDNKCVAEWATVENLFNASLPDCSSFNEDSNLTIPDISTVPCPSPLRKFCGLCLLVCGNQFPFSDSVETAFYVWQIIFLIISLSGGVINLIVSIIKYENM